MDALARLGSFVGVGGLFVGAAQAVLVFVRRRYIKPPHLIRQLNNRTIGNLFQTDIIQQITGVRGQ
jgi:hypothetical protein